MDTSLLIHQVLKKYWGYDQFRPLQEDIILSVMNGDDTLALLPTGGGKSICFQVPAMAKQGLCLVISPLIALMKDQVQHLKDKKIKAEAIFSGQTNGEIRRILDNALFDKDFKFLYISPERLKTDAFRTNLKRMNLSMVAIDEAHCISQWGYDFRPPYLDIAEIRDFFPDIPFLALTATATPEVVTDIQKQLKFKKENVFQKSFKRENLTYYVVKEQDKNGRVLRIIQKYPGTGIVYVRNRRKTEDFAKFLQQNNISADFYHAGLDGATRDKKQKEWMEGETRIIVSTNAFGMGIDKPDVRFVIHIDVPDTLEGYFQEAGRGGRDLKPSIAVMLYDDSDLKNLHKNFNSTFPPIDFIKLIYKDLCNYFRIAIGDGENQTFAFNLTDFANHYKHPHIETYHSIKLIEKTGAILLSDSEFTPSKIHFPHNLNDLKQLQKSESYQKNEPFIQLLLRSYGGVFNHFVSINETDLAQRSGYPTKEVIQTLEHLHKLNIIEYQHSTSLPLLTFCHPRIDEKYLFHDPQIYSVRKNVAEKRLRAVEDFVTRQSSCRSQMLLAYFGETNSTPCGQCDLCIKAKLQKISLQEFKQIEDAIKKHYLPCNGDLKQVIFNLSQQFAEEKVIKVARWMIDQRKL